MPGRSPWNGFFALARTFAWRCLGRVSRWVLVMVPTSLGGGRSLSLLGGLSRFVCPAGERGGGGGGGGGGRGGVGGAPGWSFGCGWPAGIVALWSGRFASLGGCCAVSAFISLWLNHPRHPRTTAPTRYRPAIQGDEPKIGSLKPPGARQG